MNAKLDETEWLVVADTLRTVAGQEAEAAARAVRAAVDARRHKLTALARERNTDADEHRVRADALMDLAERISNGL